MEVTVLKKCVKINEVISLGPDLICVIKDTQRDGPERTQGRDAVRLQAKERGLGRNQPELVLTWTSSL